MALYANEAQPFRILRRPPQELEPENSTQRHTLPPDSQLSKHRQTLNERHQQNH